MLSGRRAGVGRGRCLFFVLLWAAVLPGWSIVLGGIPDWPDQVEIGSLLDLDGPKGMVLAWEVTGTDIDGDAYEPAWREFPKDGAVAIETRYGGTLTIELKIEAAKRGLSEIKWCIVVGEGDEPGPDPPPPVPGKLFAVVVEETDDRTKLTPEQLSAINSRAAIEYMRAGGHKYEVKDDDLEDAHLQPFFKKAEGKVLPRLIIANEAGGILHDDVITTEESLLKTLKNLGGE